MKSFKAGQFHFGLLAILALGLSGCFRPTPKVDELQRDSSASFYVSDFDGRSEITETLTGYSIPSKRLYNFKICLKNRVTREDLRGEKFLVRGGQKDQEVTTEATGCMNWSEEIKYDFLTDEKCLPQERTIEAAGHHVGSRVVRFSINPWNRSGKESDFVDLNSSDANRSCLATVDETKQALLSSSDSKKSKSASLWVPEREVFLHNDEGSSAREGISRTLSLALSPSILVHDRQGQVIPFSLSEGKFTVDISFLQSVSMGGGQTKTFVVWKSKDSIPLAKQHNVFGARFEVQDFIGKDSDRMQMVIRLNPVDGPEGLKAFEAVYDIGYFQNLISDEILKPVLLNSNVKSNFSSQEHLSSLESIISEGDIKKLEMSDKKLDWFCDATAGGLRKVKPFMVSRFWAEWGRELEHLSTATERTILFHARICFKDMARGGKPATAMDGFEIILPDGRKADTRQTSSEEANAPGCLSWKDQLTHKYYESEKFYIYQVKIRHRSGYEDKRTLALYPWGGGLFFNKKDLTLAEDCEFVRDTNTREPLRSQLILDSFHFESVGYRSFEVEKDLRIRAIRPMQVRATLRINRPSNLYLGLSAVGDRFRMGVVAVRAAIYAKGKNPLGEDIEIISPMEEIEDQALPRKASGYLLASVKNGELKFSTRFSISDARLLRSRASLVLEVLPVDESKLSLAERENPILFKGDPSSVIDQSSGLKTSTYVGPLWLNAEKGGATLIASQDLASNLDGDLGSNETDKNALQSLVGVKMDQILARANEIEKSLLKVRTEEADITNILSENNLDFVSLDNEEKIEKAQPELFALNQFLTGASPLTDLVGHLNSSPYLPVGKVIDRSELFDLITEKSELPRDLGRLFCEVFFESMLNQLSPDSQFSYRAQDGDWLEKGIHRVKKALGQTWVGGNPERHSRSHYSEVCSHKIMFGENGASDVFSFEPKLRVYEVGKASFVTARKTYFNVGADVGFQHTKSWNISHDVGFNVDLFRGTWMATTDDDLVNKTGKNVEKKMARFRQKHLMKIMSAFAQSAGGKIGLIQSNWGDAHSTSEGSRVQSGVNISVEELQLKVPLKKYEQCGVIRVQPKFWFSMLDLESVNQKLSTEQIAKIGTRGILICSGDIVDQPKVISERYYTFAEGKEEEILSDKGDPRMSTLWMLSLRGTRDYAAFVNELVSRRDTSEIPDTVDIGLVPFERLTSLFYGKTPTTPGFYSVDSYVIPGKE